MTDILALHHASLVVSDTRRSLAFYVDLLGLEEDPSRPDLGYPGAWLSVGAQQLHLLQVPNPDPVEQRPAHVGRDRHTAFSVHGLDELAARLAHAGIEFTRSKSGRRAIFCRDPDGNGVELVEVPV